MLFECTCVGDTLGDDTLGSDDGSDDGTSSLLSDSSWGLALSICANQQKNGNNLQQKILTSVFNV